MTIKYLDSKRISLDTSATFSDDFSSDRWTGCKNDACDNGAPTTVTISGGNLSAVNVDVALDDRMVKALGTTLSNTTWVLQFETNVASTGTHTGLVGLVTTGGNMNNTSILCDYNGSNKIIMREYNSGLTEMGSGISISTGTQYYVTVIRTSLTALTLQVRTGSHTGTLVGSESGTITGATGLTHVQSGAYGRGSGSATYDIDNIKIYDGVTTVPTKPTNVEDNSILVEKDTAERYWRTPYSSGTGKIDDLTTDKGWTTSNGISGNGYNASDYVDFKLICPDSSSLAGGRVLVDLQHAGYLNGSNLSNTAFTARIKINYSALDQASGNENKSYIGFYSNTSWGGSTQDAFVLQLKLDYGQSSKKFYVEIMNDEVFEGSAHQTEFTSTTPTVDTDYYVEFTKNANVHTIRITTSSDYTGGETQSITYGGVENLRYFGCKARGDTQANGGNAQGKIEPDIGIWNGVTTVDSTPATWTNPVCSGTISSTATMGSNGDFDVSYTTVASKTGSGQRGCNAWKFIGQSASPYTGRNAVKGATNSDFSVSSSTAFTIAAWVKLNTLGQQHTILGYSGAYTNTFWTNLGISAANKVEGHTATNGQSNNYIPTGNSLSVDTWHHCVFIHKADKTVTVYLDADTANKGTGTGDTGSASAGFWTIAGRWGYNVTIPTLPFLDGFIDQATLWDVALSEADVTTLYNGGRLTPPSVSQNNIKGYWTFSETSGGATNKAV